MAMPIMGRVDGDRDAITAHILSRNPIPKLACEVDELVDLYFAEGHVEGVRGDIAVYQAVHETGYFAFGGDVQWQQNNYCGLGAVGGGTPGHSFASPQLGVRAHIQHLKAYASTDPLVLAVVDPRFRYVTRGVAPTWEGLNGRWAVPGVGYGERIVDNFLRTARPGAVTVSSELAGRVAGVEDGLRVAGERTLQLEGRLNDLIGRLRGALGE